MSSERSRLEQEPEVIEAVLDLRRLYEAERGCNIHLSGRCESHGPDCRYARRVGMMHGLAKRVKVAVMPEDF